MICPYCKKAFFNNEYRRKIFDICKESKSFTELKKILSISSGALTHHLKILEEEKVIKKENIVGSIGKKLKITSI